VFPTPKRPSSRAGFDRLKGAFLVAQTSENHRLDEWGSIDRQSLCLLAAAGARIGKAKIPPNLCPRRSIAYRIAKYYYAVDDPIDKHGEGKPRILV
jgi:hypothetical protein